RPRRPPSTPAPTGRSSRRASTAPTALSRPPPSPAGATAADRSNRVRTTPSPTTTMTDPAVLVVTCLTDVTADLVITALNERGARVVRLDPADALNGELEFSVSIGGAEGWRGTVSTPTRHVGVEEVATVYYRRPSAWESTYPDSQV